MCLTCNKPMDVGSNHNDALCRGCYAALCYNDSAPCRMPGCTSNLRPQNPSRYTGPNASLVYLPCTACYRQKELDGAGVQSAEEDAGTSAAAVANVDTGAGTGTGADA